MTFYNHVNHGSDCAFPLIKHYFSPETSMVTESQIEYGFVGKLQDLKYTYREDIHDRVSLERNFRQKFEALNRVNLKLY